MVIHKSPVERSRNIFVNYVLPCRSMALDANKVIAEADMTCTDGVFRSK